MEGDAAFCKGTEELQSRGRQSGEPSIVVVDVFSASMR